MAVTLSVNGVTYNYPELTDEGWGPDATNWAVAITQGVLTKAGGLFALSNNVDFGPNFGLKTVVYQTRSANIASSGQFRLSNSDTIVFRNSANSGNLSFGAGSSDSVPQYNGIDLVNLSTAQSLSNKTLVSAIFTGGTLNSPTINTPSVTGGTFSAPVVTGGTFTGGTFNSISLNNPSITGAVLFSNGSAALPSIANSTSTTTGLYWTTNTLNFSANGVNSGSIDPNGTWTIGQSGTSHQQLIYGSDGNTQAKSLILASGSATDFTIARENNTGSLTLTGSSANNNGALISLYGNANATPNITKFQNAGANTGSISAAGLWTIGATGGTQTHVINGNLNITGSLLTSLVFPNGSAAAPSVASSSNTTTGLYWTTNTLNFSTNGVNAGSIDPNGTWIIGEPGTTHQSTIYGSDGNIQGKSLILNSGSSTDFTIARNDNTGSLTLTGSSANNTGAVFSVFGNGLTQFQNSGVTTGSISSAGLWTIGASTSTQNHIINGSLSIVNASGANIDAFAIAILTDNTTNGVVVANPVATSTNWFVDYSLTRTTGRKTGTLHIVSDGTTAQVINDSVAIGDPGVSFSADVSGGNVRLLYTTTSTGSNVTMKYTTKRWNA